MIVIIPQVGYGAGRHVQYIKPSSDIVKGLRLNFVTQPLCLLALCLTKISVGVFLLRMTQKARLRLFIRGTMILTAAASLANLCMKSPRMYIFPQNVH